MECIPGGVVGVRQWPSRYTTHTGQYLPGKECCYLRTLVLVYTYGHPSPYTYAPWAPVSRSLPVTGNISVEHEPHGSEGVPRTTRILGVRGGYGSRGDTGVVR